MKGKCHWFECSRGPRVLALMMEGLTSEGGEEKVETIGTSHLKVRRMAQGLWPIRRCR